jgi:hypothetical protein
MAGLTVRRAWNEPKAPADYASAGANVTAVPMLAGLIDGPTERLLRPEHGALAWVRVKLDSPSEAVVASDFRRVATRRGRT